MGQTNRLAVNRGACFTEMHIKLSKEADYKLFSFITQAIIITGICSTYQLSLSNTLHVCVYKLMGGHGWL